VIVKDCCAGSKTETKINNQAAYQRRSSSLKENIHVICHAKVVARKIARAEPWSHSPIFAIAGGFESVFPFSDTSSRTMKFGFRWNIGNY
jgi:hypothetical protein